MKDEKRGNEKEKQKTCKHIRYRAQAIVERDFSERTRQSESKKNPKTMWKIIYAGLAFGLKLYTRCKITQRSNKQSASSRSKALTKQKKKNTTRSLSLCRALTSARTNKTSLNCTFARHSCTVFGRFSWYFFVLRVKSEHTLYVFFHLISVSREITIKLITSAAKAPNKPAMATRKTQMKSISGWQSARFEKKKQQNQKSRKTNQ